MTGADSDSDQSSENEVIPFRQKAAPDQTTDAQDSDSSDDENEDAGEDTYVHWCQKHWRQKYWRQTLKPDLYASYVVEEICSHAFDENVRASVFSV